MKTFPRLQEEPNTEAYSHGRGGSIQESGQVAGSAGRRVVGSGIHLHTYDASIGHELSKGRYDVAVLKSCFKMLLELFGRSPNSNLSLKDKVKTAVKNVCWA